MNKPLLMTSHRRFSTSPRSIGRLVELGLGSLAILALLGIALWTSDVFIVTTALLIVVNSVLGMSVVVLYGYAGQLSFAYPVIFGAGAYISTFLIIGAGWNGPIAAIVGGLGAAAIGLVLSLPALRVHGLQLGLLTLALGFAGVEIFAVISGHDGIVGIPPFQIGDWMALGPNDELLVVVLFMAIIYTAFKLLLRGRTGRRLLLLKSDETTASGLGLNLFGTKALAFAVSSAPLGLLGGIYAMILSYLGPDLFGFELLITVFAVTILGGMTRLEGPILGAIVFAILPRLAQNTNAQPLIFGVLLLLSLVLLRSGLLGLIIAGVEKLVRGRMARKASPERRSAEPSSADKPERTARPIVTANGPAILRLTAVSKSFDGLAAVQDVNLKIAPGALTALIGSNGAGKSTLLSIVCGQLGADTGRIEFEGIDISRWSAARRAREGLVRTLQFPHLVPELTVLENIRLGGETHREGLRDEKHLNELVEVLGLGPYLDWAPDSIPSGLVKFVDLARAAASRPRLLLLDEPAAGIAPSELPALEEAFDILLATGATLLVVEHNMEFLLPTADRVYALDYGRVIAEGTAESVSRVPEVVAAYLGDLDG